MHARTHAWVRTAHMRGTVGTYSTHAWVRTGAAVHCAALQNTLTHYIHITHKVHHTVRKFMYIKPHGDTLTHTTCTSTIKSLHQATIQHIQLSLYQVACTFSRYEIYCTRYEL